MSYCIGDEPVKGYRLEERLGSGGFGEVWRARGPGGTQVALKMVNLSGGSVGLKEFRALQRVKRVRPHPNLVPLNGFWIKNDRGALLSEEEVDQLDTGDSRARPTELVIAMGLCDKTLSELLKHREEAGHLGIERDELFRYLEDAAAAIDHMNQPQYGTGNESVGIQHCDVKPSNILLMSGKAVVGDFGLAREINDRRIRRDTSIPALTFEYAAPELLDDPPRPSRSTDQYMLAITYCELRTGRLPFRSRQINVIIDSHIKGHLDLSGLPEKERPIVQKATSVDPEQRYVSCQEFIQALKKSWQQSTWPKDGQSAARPSSNPNLLATGIEIVPGYKLVEKLGEGGYGEVWRAKAAGGVDAAIKVIRNVDRLEGQQEFRGLQLIKRVEHAHLLTLRGCWLLTADGQTIPEEEWGVPGTAPSVLVIATDVGTENLAQRLRKCVDHGELGIPALELLRYLDQAAKAIDYLNEPTHLDGERLVSIVHRDIKPENILLKNKHVLVADFGLVMVLEGTTAGITRRNVAFTAHYAAPEVLDHGVSRWSDQFSLAITYYKLRTNRLPFDERISNPSRMFRVYEEGLLDFSLVSEAEAEVLRRATAFEPENRYKTCLAMVRALDKAAKTGGAQSAPPAKQSDQDTRPKTVADPAYLTSYDTKRMDASRRRPAASATAADAPPEPPQVVDRPEAYTDRGTWPPGGETVGGQTRQRDGDWEIDLRKLPSTKPKSGKLPETPKPATKPIPEHSSDLSKLRRRILAVGAVLGLGVFALLGVLLYVKTRPQEHVRTEPSKVTSTTPTQKVPTKEDPITPPSLAALLDNAERSLKAGNGQAALDQLKRAGEVLSPSTEPDLRKRYFLTQAGAQFNLEKWDEVRQTIATVKGELPALPWNAREEALLHLWDVASSYKRSSDGDALLAGIRVARERAYEKQWTQDDQDSLRNLEDEHYRREIDIVPKPAREKVYVALHDHSPERFWKHVTDRQAMEKVLKEARPEHQKYLDIKNRVLANIATLETEEHFRSALKELGGLPATDETYWTPALRALQVEANLEANSEKVDPNNLRAFVERKDTLSAPSSNSAYVHFVRGLAKQKLGAPEAAADEFVAMIKADSDRKWLGSRRWPKVISTLTRVVRDKRAIAEEGDAFASPFRNDADRQAVARWLTNFDQSLAADETIEARKLRLNLALAVLGGKESTSPIRDQVATKPWKDADAAWSEFGLDALMLKYAEATAFGADKDSAAHARALQAHVEFLKIMGKAPKEPSLRDLAKNVLDSALRLQVQERTPEIRGNLASIHANYARRIDKNPHVLGPTPQEAKRKTLNHFAAAVELEPNVPEYQVGLGYALLQQEEKPLPFERVANCLQRALEHEHGREYPRAYALKGYLEYLRYAGVNERQKRRAHLADGEGAYLKGIELCGQDKDRDGAWPVLLQGLAQLNVALAHFERKRAELLLQESITCVKQAQERYAKLGFEGYARQELRTIRGNALEDLALLAGRVDSYRLAFDEFRGAGFEHDKQPKLIIGQGRCAYRFVAFGKGKPADLLEAAKELETWLPTANEKSLEFEARYWLAHLHLRRKTADCWEAATKTLEPALSDLGKDDLPDFQRDCIVLWAYVPLEQALATRDPEQQREACKVGRQRGKRLNDAKATYAYLDVHFLHGRFGEIEAALNPSAEVNVLVEVMAYYHGLYQGGYLGNTDTSLNVLTRLLTVMQLFQVDADQIIPIRGVRSALEGEQHKKVKAVFADLQSIRNKTKEALGSDAIIDPELRARALAATVLVNSRTKPLTQDERRQVIDVLDQALGVAPPKLLDRLEWLREMAQVTVNFLRLKPAENLMKEYREKALRRIEPALEEFNNDADLNSKVSAIKGQ